MDGKDSDNSVRKPDDDSESPATDDLDKPEKYTDEWYNSVEKRFGDVGDFMRELQESRRGKAARAATESESAPTPATPSEGQSASDETADGTVSAGTLTRDTRPPKSNHFWFRRFGE